MFFFCQQTMISFVLWTPQSSQPIRAFSSSCLAEAYSCAEGSKDLKRIFSYRSDGLPFGVQYIPYLAKTFSNIFNQMIHLGFGDVRQIWVKMTSNPLFFASWLISRSSNNWIVQPSHSKNQLRRFRFKLMRREGVCFASAQPISSNLGQLSRVFLSHLNDHSSDSKEQFQSFSEFISWIQQKPTEKRSLKGEWGAVAIWNQTLRWFNDDIRFISAFLDVQTVKKAICLFHRCFPAFWTLRFTFWKKRGRISDTPRSMSCNKDRKRTKMVTSPPKLAKLWTSAVINYKHELKLNTQNHPT